MINTQNTKNIASIGSIALPAKQAVGTSITDNGTIMVGAGSMWSTGGCVSY